MLRKLLLRPAGFINFQTAQISKLYNFVHQPFALFLRRVRLAEELSQSRHVNNGILYHFLIFQEQYFVRKFRSCFPVARRKLLDRKAQTLLLARGVQVP